MILAHHGWGEELALYAAAGGGAAIPAFFLLWRMRFRSLRGRLAALGRRSHGERSIRGALDRGRRIRRLEG